MATKQIFHAKTQQVEDVEVTVDANNEIVATFADGHTLKFPAGIDAATLDKLIAAHEKANTGQEPVTEEQVAAQAAEQAASYAAIGETPPVPEVESGAEVVAPEVETPAEDASPADEGDKVTVTTSASAQKGDKTNAPVTEPTAEPAT